MPRVERLVSINIFWKYTWCLWNGWIFWNLWFSQCDPALPSSQVCLVVLVWVRLCWLWSWSTMWPRPMEVTLCLPAWGSVPVKETTCTMKWLSPVSSTWRTPPPRWGSLKRSWETCEVIYACRWIWLVKTSPPPLGRPGVRTDERAPRCPCQSGSHWPDSSWVLPWSGGSGCAALHWQHLQIHTGWFWGTWKEFAVNFKNCAWK